jgi:hypothetical protein
MMVVALDYNNELKPHCMAHSMVPMLHNMAENVKVRYNEIIDDSFLEVYADYVVRGRIGFRSPSFRVG